MRTLEDFLIMVIFLTVTAVCIYAIYTDEYEVERLKRCSEYSVETGKCIKNHSFWACVRDGVKTSTVHVCGDKVDECNKVCNHYNQRVK